MPDFSRKLESALVVLFVATLVAAILIVDHFAACAVARIKPSPVQRPAKYYNVADTVFPPPGPDTNAPRWKIRVDVTTDDNKVAAQMVPVDENRQPLTWPSMDACVLFVHEDTFKNALIALAKSLIEQGFDPDHTTVKTSCIEVPKPDSI